MPSHSETILLTNRDVHLMAAQIVEQARGLDSDAARERHDTICPCGEPASRSQWDRCWTFTTSRSAADAD